MRTPLGVGQKRRGDGRLQSGIHEKKRREIAQMREAAPPRQAGGGQLRPAAAIPSRAGKFWARRCNTMWAAKQFRITCKKLKDIDAMRLLISISLFALALQKICAQSADDFFPGGLKPI